MTSPADRRPPFEPARLGPSLPGRLRVEVVEQTGSTNADLAARARSGSEAAGLVLVAEDQVRGKGRLDRSWVSPARAGLTFSVLLEPAGVPAAQWGWLSLLAGLSVVEGLDELGALDAPGCEVKWPNDVLHAGAKLGGLLAERVETPGGPMAVVGVGLNVTTTQDELPVPGATSLALAGSAVLDRAEILGAVLRVLVSRFEQWRSGGAGSLRAAYEARCATIGAEVEVQLPGDRTLRGTGVRIAQDGALVVAEAGRETTVRAGDVVHVRRGDKGRQARTVS